MFSQKQYAKIVYHIVQNEYASVCYIVSKVIFRDLGMERISNWNAYEWSEYFHDKHFSWNNVIDYDNDTIREIKRIGLGLYTLCMEELLRELLRTNDFE